MGCDTKVVLFFYLNFGKVFFQAQQIPRVFLKIMHGEFGTFLQSDLKTETGNQIRRWVVSLMTSSFSKSEIGMSFVQIFFWFSATRLSPKLEEYEQEEEHLSPTLLKLLS